MPVLEFSIFDLKGRQMKKMFVVGAAIAAFGLVNSASAADMPVKAPIAARVAAPYDWSGFYIGGTGGYEWASVHDIAPGNGFVTDSTVRNGIIGGVVGAQYQFGNAPWGAWLVGVEAALNDPTSDNSTSNFGLCANPAFGCGLTRLDNLTTVGARLGIAADRWLFTVSGGWASARFDRTDVLFATGALGTGGGGSDERHDGAYVGGGVEYMIWKAPFADLIGGIDYQHIWLNDHDDLDVNGVIHRMRADTDIVRARLALKFNPWGH